MLYSSLGKSQQRFFRTIDTHIRGTIEKLQRRIAKRYSNDVNVLILFHRKLYILSDFSMPQKQCNDNCAIENRPRVGLEINWTQRD